MCSMTRLSGCFVVVLALMFPQSGCKSQGTDEAAEETTQTGEESTASSKESTGSGQERSAGATGEGKSESNGRNEENLVVNGSFEELDGKRPRGWTEKVGARSADQGGESSWEIVDVEGRGKVLKMSGGKGTAVWKALYAKPIDVEAGMNLRVAATIKARDVRQEANQYKNCNVAVQFRDANGQVVQVGKYPAVGTNVLEDSVNWMRVDRTVTVPERAATARVFAFLSMSGTAWFDDVKLEWVE